MTAKGLFYLISGLLISAHVLAREPEIPAAIDRQQFNPATLMWYDTAARAWEEALPVGNGRLGAMVFGRPGEERIQLNEETYWSGGPYSTVVKGGAEALPEIQKALFEGKPIEAHRIFGRRLMGYPVEQQKYQSLANLHLFFDRQGEVSGYKRWLDLETGISGVEYSLGDTLYRREVIASAPDQVIVVRLTSGKPGSLSFRAQLRGCRNQAHSNYGTDYFRMDGVDHNGLLLTGKSADYLGVEGAIRYRAQLKAFAPGGRMEVDGIDLRIEGADTVILVIAAATNFVSYRDVSGNPRERVSEILQKISDRSPQSLFEAAMEDHRALFDRVSIELPVTSRSYRPTDKRMVEYTSEADPSLAALCYNFARYVLIASSREGTQPSNLQGIWNEDMNPSWDSKYTTNINTEMNYWPVETGNLAECAEPLITMVKELSDQGARVAREHYGAGGWVFHQNTDLWRVAAPMDGPCWGTFTTGGAWLCTQLYEHYLFNPDPAYLEEIYPLIKGAVEFFMDFLIEHPNGRWLVTSPSTSPENPPKGPGYRYFFDEVTGMYYFTTICYGSTIDMQILTDLFRIYGEMEAVLGMDPEFATKVLEARGRLVPPLVGKDGTLQEWTEDYGQLEDKHRHFSHMYGLYPGNVISAKNTPDLIDACKAVLEQRGDGGTGFSRAWKMALWARLCDGNRAARIFEGYIAEQSYPQLFAKCFTPLQIDGTQGVAAGITEMLIQSHEGVIDLLPALPDAWGNGNFQGVCARGGFELKIHWEEGEITRVEIRSRYGHRCRINPGGTFKVLSEGRKLRSKSHTDGSLAFDTEAGTTYTLIKQAPF